MVYVRGALGPLRSLLSLLPWLSLLSLLALLSLLPLLFQLLELTTHAVQPLAQVREGEEVRLRHSLVHVVAQQEAVRVTR